MINHGTKNCWKYLLLLFFAINLVNAQEIKFSKNSFSSGETVSFEINFDFYPIGDLDPLQVRLYDNLGNEVGISINLVKIEQNHYLSYFDLPTNLQDGSYTLMYYLEKMEY